jgi:membrane associated rhomboid family serine protease
MGLAERDYQRGHPRQTGFLAALPPVVRWLLIINVAVFLIDYLILPLATGMKVDDFNPPLMLRWGAFAVQSAVFEFRLYEFLTFQFLHASFGHLLFNMLGLYFFGPWIERWWGSRSFLIYYLACGAAGALLFMILLELGVVPGNRWSPLVGASAGIYGILIGIAVIAPELRVRLLFPPITLTMRTLALCLLGIAIGSIALGWGGNEGGEAGHLGGAILGFILMKKPGWLGSRDLLSGLRHARRRRETEAKLRPRTAVNFQDDEVDEILDQISRDGIHSLSQEQREVLDRHARKQKS